MGERQQERMAKETSANRRAMLRRTLPALAAALAAWALASSVFALNVTEYGLVTRFGRVTRVVDEPGLHVALPFEHVVRLDKRILFFRPAPSEYLTIDKKNFGVDSLVAWRIADPQKFLAALATPAAGRSIASMS
jgi:membrane protease subunit HflC